MLSFVRGHRSAASLPVFLGSEQFGSSSRFGVVLVRLVNSDAAENHAGIDSTEAKRVAQNVTQINRSPMLGNNVQIAGRIGAVAI